MIQARFLILKSGRIIGFQANGHSGYDEIGKDIVCAAVSSAVFMVINTIRDILKIPLETEIDENKTKISFCLEEKDAKVCSNILEGLKIHFNFLEEMYPKNIKVDYMEVQIC